MTVAIRCLFTLTALVAAAWSAPGDVVAQPRLVHGRVWDSTGAPVVNADIGVLSQRRLVRSDSLGRFVLPDFPTGRSEVTVRRLGFRPRRFFIDPDTLRDSLQVTLASEPAVLAGIGVTARESRLRHGIEDFYRRRVKGVGTYWTRDDIEQYNTQRTSDVLRGAPGIRLVRVSSGMGVRFNSTSIVRRDCTPMIWMDGQRAPGLEVDDILARDIEGIELYGGPATTPMQFSQYSSSSTCGTIVIWTRIPGR